MSSPRGRAARAGARHGVLVACAASLVALASFADEPTKAPTPVAKAATPILIPAKPYWPELTAVQRQALQPLADDWERLDSQTKKKWVEIANRYPKMQPDEQARTRDRMREWALLTPDQRRIARDSFARIRAMPPEQRAEMLRQYQALPAERKQALVVEGRAVKPLVVPKVTAAAPGPAAVRRTQIREGAKAPNPAIAARKSNAPVAAPSGPAPAPPAALPAASPAPAAPPAAAASAPPSAVPPTPAP